MVNQLSPHMYSAIHVRVHTMCIHVHVHMYSAIYVHVHAAANVLYDSNAGQERSC